MFPTVKELAEELEGHKSYIEDDFKEDPDDEDEEPGMDVRLQVQKGGWSLRTGDSSYDLDHCGWWGAGFLTQDTDCEELADELISEAMDHRAQCEPEEQNDIPPQEVW